MPLFEFLMIVFFKCISHRKIGDIQIRLNIALSNLDEYYKNHDQDGIILIFKDIMTFLPEEYLFKKDFRDCAVEIFKAFDFHTILIDLLQYEEWRNVECAVTMLSYLINTEDELIINYLIRNNLINIINSCIIANDDTTYIALRCLGNFIAITEGQFQELICNIINFEDIIPYFYKCYEILFHALFLLDNIIYFFKYIPFPEQFVNLLKKLILCPRNAEEIISLIIQCLIDMIQVDSTVLNLIFDNSYIDLDDSEYCDQDIFSEFYNIFLPDYITKNTKKKILLLFVTICRVLNNLAKENADQQIIFLEMKENLFRFAFNSFESFKIARFRDSLGSNCVSMVLELLSNSIRVSQEFQENLKDVYKIILNAIDVYNQYSFKLKKPSLNLLLAFIEVFCQELDVLRFMRENNVQNILVDGLSFDDPRKLVKILKSIILIVDAFQNSIESYDIKKDFMKLDLDIALDELENFDDDDIKYYLKLVKYRVYDDENDPDN